MKDSRKTKAVLLDELAELRREVARLKVVEAECIELQQQSEAAVPVGSVSQQSNVIDVRSAEEAIRESNERYRDLYEEAPISYYSVGVDGFIRRVNQHMVKMLGYSRDELIGKRILELYADTPEGKGKVKELFPLFQAGNEVHAELEMRRVDGKSIWIDLSVRPIFDEEGQVVESRAAAVDITERKLAEETVVKRATELEIVTQVSSAAATILESEKLLQEVVDLTKTSFDLYHAHIYLLDDAGDILNLVAGAGDAGRQMVAEGWNIPLVQEQSLVARAARAQQGVIVNDVRKAPDWLPNSLLPDTRSELAVPMIARGRVVGVLDVQADEVDYFTEEDIRIQTTLAAQVAVAIENARLFEQERKVATELEEQAHHLTGLNELSRDLSQVTNENQIFEIAARRLPQIIQADRASVALLTSMGDNFDVLALAGEAGVIPIGTQVPVEGTALGKAVHENHVIIASDIRDSGFPEHRQLAEQGLRSTMNVPLMAGGRVIGVLSVGSKKLDAYDIRHQSLMLQAVSLLSSAIENLRLLQQTQERAKELEETTTFLDSIFENIPNMVFVKDAEDLRFVRFNRAGAELIGVSREDMIGKNDYDFFTKEEADFFTTKDRDVLAGGKLVDIPEEPIHTVDKGTRILHTRKVPVIGVDGKPRYLLGISEDITERKQAEAERERLLAEVEAAYRQYVRKEWEQFLHEQHQGRWLIEHQQQSDVQPEATSEALGSIQDEVVHKGTLKAISGNGDNEPQGEATIVAPISLRGQVIGTLGLQDVNPDRQWTSEELGLVETVTEQLALTIENLRLFDDSQHRATREQLTRKITDRMRASPDADSIIRTGLTELANALGVSRTYVKLASTSVEDEETDGT